MIRATSAINVWGRAAPTRKPVRQASTFMLGVAAFFMLFAGSIGLFLRYVIPRMQESWYR